MGAGLQTLRRRFRREIFYLLAETVVSVLFGAVFAIVLDRLLGSAIIDAIVMFIALTFRCRSAVTHWARWGELNDLIGDLGQLSASGESSDGIAEQLHRFEAFLLRHNRG